MIIIMEVLHLPGGRVRVVCQATGRGLLSGLARHEEPGVRQGGRQGWNIGMLIEVRAPCEWSPSIKVGEVTCG